MGVTSASPLPFSPETHVFSTVFKLLQSDSTLFKHLWLVTLGNGRCAFPVQSLKKGKGAFFRNSPTGRKCNATAINPPGKNIQAAAQDTAAWAICPKTPFYLANRLWMRRQTSSTFSRELNAEMRKNPSPLEPKPEPGVITTFASCSILSNICQLSRPSGHCTHT